MSKIRAGSSTPDRARKGPPAPTDARRDRAARASSAPKRLAKCRRCALRVWSSQLNHSGPCPRLRTKPHQRHSRRGNTP